MLKASGGVGGGGSPPHDVRRSNDARTGTLFSANILKSSGGVGGGGAAAPPIMFEEVMLQQRVPYHDDRRSDVSAKGALMFEEEMMQEGVPYSLGRF